MTEQAEKLREALRHCVNGLEVRPAKPVAAVAIASLVCDTLGITGDNVIELRFPAPGVGRGCTCADCVMCRDSLNQSADALDALLEVAGRAHGAVK